MFKVVWFTLPCRSRWFTCPSLWCSQRRLGWRIGWRIGWRVHFSSSWLFVIVFCHLQNRFRTVCLFEGTELCVTSTFADLSLWEMSWFLDNSPDVGDSSVICTRCEEIAMFDPKDRQSSRDRIVVSLLWHLLRHRHHHFLASFLLFPVSSFGLSFSDCFTTWLFRGKHFLSAQVPFYPFLPLGFISVSSTLIAKIDVNKIVCIPSRKVGDDVSVVDFVVLTVHSKDMHIRVSFSFSMLLCHF